MADSNRCQAVGHVGENQEYKDFSYILIDLGYVKSLALALSLLST